MTPVEVATFARQQYNAVNDSFFTDEELYTAIYSAQMELARESQCIRRSYQTTSVAGQRTYTRPSNALAIKRIDYNGAKLKKVTDRDADAVNLFNQIDVPLGTPTFYWEWDTSLYLQNTPDTDGLTITIYTYDKPQAVSSTSTLDVPDRYHHDLANYLLQRMAMKDKNPDAATLYGQLWQKALQDAKRYERKFLRGDSFTAVMDEDMFPVTILGPA